MEYAFYGVLILFVIVGGIQLYINKKKGIVTDDGYEAVRKIIYNTIDNVIGLYSVKSDKDEFIAYVINVVRTNIVESKLVTETDLNFWTDEKINIIVKPVVLELIGKLDTLKK